MMTINEKLRQHLTSQSFQTNEKGDGDADKPWPFNLELAAVVRISSVENSFAYLQRILREELHLQSKSAPS